VPFSGERKGKAAVAEFFRQVAESEDFEQFEPREFVAQGDKVVALGHYRAVVKATGRTFGSDFVMVFTLRDGKIAAFQEFTDSAGINAAFA
jgi:ketosteroid isomerase-like protein